MHAGSVYSSQPSSNPQKQKIFGIGLSKTGTSSLCKALQILGYSVVDFDNGLKHIDQFDAATDTPIAEAFELLDRRYPGSCFVYTVRDRKPWLQSIERHWKLLQSLPEVPEDSALFHRLYGLPHYGFNRQTFSQAYDRHDRRVRAYFEDRSDLLIMNVCAGDGWEKLCPFLEQPTPTERFPQTNVRIGKRAVTFKQLRRRGKEILRSWLISSL